MAGPGKTIPKTLRLNLRRYDWMSIGTISFQGQTVKLLGCTRWALYQFQVGLKLHVRGVVTSVTHLFSPIYRA